MSQYLSSLFQGVQNLRQGLDVLAEKIIGGDIQGVAEKQVAQVDRLAVAGLEIDLLVRAIQGTAVGNGLEENLEMGLEDVKVANALLNEEGPNKLPAGVPRVAVCGEDGIAQKLAPFSVEGLALAIVVELLGENGLDVFGVSGEDDAFAEQAGLCSVAVNALKQMQKALIALVLHDGVDLALEDIDRCEVCQYVLRSSVGPRRGMSYRKAAC